MRTKIIKFLDGLLILVLLLMVLGTGVGHVRYYLGDGYLEDLGEVLAGLLILRLATGLSLQRWKRLPPVQQFRLAVCAAVLPIMLYQFVGLGQSERLNTVILDRDSRGLAAETISEGNEGDHFRWFPRRSLINEIEERVGEHEGILYFGDFRPHLLSALIYPRRLYAVPVLQDALNINEQDRYGAVNEIYESLDPRFLGKPIGLMHPDAHAELEEVFQSRDFQWVLIYDAVYADRTQLFPMTDLTEEQTP